VPERPALALLGRTGRLLALLLAGVLGGGVGVLATFQARHVVVVSGAAVPVGLVPALVGTAAVVVLAGALVGSRVAAAAAAAGWLAAVIVISAGRPEGDVVIAGDTEGLVWLGLGALAASVPVALPYRPTGGGSSGR